MRTTLFGGTGLAGSGIARNLSGVNELSAPKSSEVNLLDYTQVKDYFSRYRPNVVIMAAGKVGGIEFNSSNQLYQFQSNLQMNLNVLNAANENNIEKLCLLSSSCIYPSTIDRPYSEEEVFKGLPEVTNEGYALAKSTAIRALKIFRNKGKNDWFAVIPTNIYGLEDNFSKTGHLIGSTINKFITNKNEEKVNFLGTGVAKRQFLHNNDLGNCINMLIQKELVPEIINISTQETFTVKEIISQIASIFDFKGEIVFDGNKNFDGNLDKSLSTERINKMGWTANIQLEHGLEHIISNLLDSSI
jgi:GDP-L-fucose synthase